MRPLSLIYGNFARFDKHLLAIPDTTPEYYEHIVLNDRVLSRLFEAAQALDEYSNIPGGEYYAPTIFTAQLVGHAAEYVTLVDTGNDRGIVEDRNLLRGITHEYWDRVASRGLKPVINTTLDAWPPLGPTPSPDFTLLGVKFPRQ